MGRPGELRAFGPTRSDDDRLIRRNDSRGTVAAKYLRSQRHKPRRFVGVETAVDIVVAGVLLIIVVRTIQGPDIHEIVEAPQLR